MTTSAVEIAAIMDRLREVHIGTSTFRALQDQIRALFRIGPDGEPTHEPIRFTAGTEAHGVILVAGPGTGKTTDLHHVLRGFHALQDNPETGMPRYLHISVASPATLRSLGCQFLEKLGLERVSDRSKVHEIWSMVRKLLQRGSDVEPVLARMAQRYLPRTPQPAGPAQRRPQSPSGHGRRPRSPASTR